LPFTVTTCNVTLTRQVCIRP